MLYCAGQTEFLPRKASKFKECERIERDIFHTEVKLASVVPEKLLAIVVAKIR